MNPTTLPAVRPKWSLTDYLANRLVADPVPRADATHRKFVKRPGGIWLELGNLHENNCGQRYHALEQARDEKVNGAGAIREQKLKEEKARHEVAVAAIEQEHRNVAGNAALDFERAEQALLQEFSAPPVVAAAEVVS